MIKLLLGGSPCTHWSIAQKNNRETEAEGIGWELFRNYLIAKEKFQPDYFLYENNKSAAQPIKDQISRELGVPLQYINSALVSAQNRRRFYAHNIPNVPQPEDRRILLRDVLDSAIAWQEKSYALTTRCNGAIPKDTLEKHRHTMVAEPVCMRYERIEEAKRVRKQYEAGKLHHGFNELNELHPRPDGKTNTLSTVLKDNPICEPVRIGTIENNLQNPNHDSKQYRVYSPDGKATTLCGKGGGVGAKTGLYACPIDYHAHKNSDIVITDNSMRCQRRDAKHSTIQGTHVTFDDGKTQTLSTNHIPMTFIQANGKVQPVYEVRNGLITIKDKQYPIKLADGYYRIRKLTVPECMRLQTVPDWYVFPVSNTQAYKMLGNGWTVEVIKHILSHIPNIQDEEIVVLSMFDGMSCGQIALKELGCNVVKYYATEIDKYAIKTTQHNFPDTIQLGDAFQVRDSLFAFEQNETKSDIA